MTQPPHDPADEPADERLVLLNAYVDGEATPEERAQVEGDPALLAEAQQLQSTKALVTDVTPPSDGIRTQLLDAAMAEFQATSAPPPPPSAAPPPPPPPTTGPGSVSPMPPPTPARPAKRSRSPWLTRAAAVVGVLVVGGAAFTAIQSGGDGEETDDAAFYERQPETDSDEGGVGEAPSEQEDGAAPRDEDGDVSVGNADEGAEDDMGAAPAPGDAGDGAGSGSTGELRELTSTDDLAEWYEDARYGGYDAPGSGTTQCDTPILGEAVYNGTPVYITTSRDDEINALDIENCQPIESTPVP